jgi:hypothetical protein
MSSTCESFDVIAASDALARAGFQVEPSALRVEAREERWAVHLPGERLAWFTASSRGVERLRRERRILRLLEDRCTFLAPRVLFESDGGELDVRSLIPGTSDTWRVYAAVRAHVDVATQIGSAVGAILAEQHSRIRSSDVSGWLHDTPSWPESRAWVSERIERVVDDPELVASANLVMEIYEDVRISEADRALVHTDVALHNLAIDQDTLAVRGIFDYDGAAWADRHHDFRYLIFDFERRDLLEAAIAAYEPVVGARIQRERVFLYNAACAVSYLAYRDGTSPESRSCGRTLAEDVRWSRHAIAHALA